jgi:hypothetical protein
MGTNPSTFTNRNNTSTDSGVIYVNDKTYTLARSETFYYLQFINYDKELFKTASNLTSKPTLIFYTEGATDKIIVDYTLANTTDKKYLNSFFANMTSGGETFSLIKGEYLDAAELTADVSCTVTFASYNDYKAFGSVVSVTETNTASDVYLSEYFTGTPQISKTGSLGYTASTENYALVSVNPNTDKPLSYMGITAGDVIEVVNNSSSNSHSLFEIAEITSINNKEVLKLNSIYNNPAVESLIGSASVLNVYVKGTTTSTAGFTGDVGCCYNFTEKIKNNTEYQCSIRTGYTFNKTDCDLVTLPVSSATTVPYRTIVNTYNTSSEVQSSNVVFDSYITYKDENTPVLELRISSNDGGAYLENKQIIFQNGKKYCFEQIDISNNNFILRLSTTQNVYTPYTTGIYSAIRSQGINSFTFLNTSYNTYPTLYVFLEYKLPSNPINAVPELIKTDYYLSY